MFRIRLLIHMLLRRTTVSHWLSGSTSGKVKTVDFLSDTLAKIFRGGHIPNLRDFCQLL